MDVLAQVTDQLSGLGDQAEQFAQAVHELTKDGLFESEAANSIVDHVLSQQVILFRHMHLLAVAIGQVQGGSH